MTMMAELARRAVRLGRSITSRRPVSATHQRLALVASGLVFVAATVVAWRNLPPIEGGVHWWPFVLVGVLGVPASIWNRGAEFGAVARLAGRHVGVQERVRVAVIGTAANILPIPGSVMVRGEVLRRKGVPVRTIGWATAITAAVWIGSTGLVAGGLLAALSTRHVLGAVLATGGAALCAGASWSVLRRPGVAEPGRALGHLFAVEVASIVLGGLRLWGVLAGLGYDAEIQQAVGLTVAGLVSSAVGFAPAGLGVRELAAAAISPLVGLPTSLGLLAAALNRLIELVVLSPASIGLVTRRLPTAAATGEAAAAQAAAAEAATGEAATGEAATGGAGDEDERKGVRR
jgi:hypothetical protein